MFDLKIAGGTVLDGTGAPPRRADVGITGDRIEAVGDLAHEGAGRTLDVAGATLLLWDRKLESFQVLSSGGQPGEILKPGQLVQVPDTRFLLIGGEPFQEELLMWWNFVGRTHDEAEQAREDWEAQAGLPETATAAARYGLVPGHGPDAGAEAGRIPAPPLPAVRLTPRKRSVG